MNKYLYLAAVIALYGCSGIPPKPSMPEGDFRPINSRALNAYTYQGDIQGALNRLIELDPSISVVAHEGVIKDIPITLEIKNATVFEVLSEIGAQAGRQAEIVWHTNQNNRGGKVYIKYLSGEKQ